MASTYSTNLRLELIGTGEQQGTWGNTTNTNLGTLLEEAIGGYTSVTVFDVGDTTLTTANGAVDQARNMTLNLTGTISAARNVICPAIEKVYVVKNATTGGFPVTFKVSGQTGVSIPNGGTYFVYVDGTDARRVTGSIASQDASGVAITGGTINVGDTQAPRSDLQMTATTNPTAVVVGSISGTTLTVSAVTSGTLAVGDRLTIAASGLDYNTYIVALGTGTGGTGTYTINNTTTLSSATLYAFSSAYNTLTFYEKDTTAGTNQSLGGIEWFGSDASTPGGGVKAYVAAISESTTPDSALVFGTSDNVASTQAVERMRIDSSGNVGIGITSPTVKLDVSGTMQASTSVVANDGTIVNRMSVGGGVGYLGTTSNHPVTISTNNVERMRINSSGNVGIGTTSPTRSLDVVGNVRCTEDSSAKYFVINSVGVQAGVGVGMFAPAGSTLGFTTNSTERFRIDSSGNVLVTGAGGLGYGTGSGGSVTQATSKSTAVTLNKTNGKITMNAAALASGANVQFTLNNSTIAATDTVIVTPNFGAASYHAWVYYVGAGLCYISVTQNSGGSRSDAVVLNFAVIKAVTS